MNHDMTTGSVWKKLLLFMLPVFGANLLQALYGTVDLIVVGQFASTADVSAVSTGSMTMQTITGIITGLTMGCTVRIGHLIGQKNKDEAARTVGTALTLFLGIGVLLAVLICIFASPLASVMNAPEDAFSATVSYIRICGIGILAIFLFNACSGIFRGIGDSRTPLLLMLIACIANIIGDLILVEPFHMGAAGAALATVLAQAVSVAFAIPKILNNELGFPFGRKDFGVNRTESAFILRYGLPIAAQEALTGVSFMVILAILNGFGLVASAGVGVAEKICSLMFLIPGAAMAAVSTFSAQNVGAGEYKRAKSAMYLGMVWTVVVGLAVFLFSFAHGALLARLFSDDKEVIAAAADYLRSYAVDCVIIGINFSMMGYLNGNGKTFFVALQGILSTFLVRIPVSYFMSKIAGVTLFQIGFATPLATLFGIILNVIYLIHFERTRRTKQTA